MTDPFRELLKGLDAQMSGQSLQEKSDRVAEEGFVVFLLKHFKLERWKKTLHDECRNLYGTPYLRLEPFLAKFPSFPVHLVFRRVKKLFPRVNVLSLWNNFVNLPFMEAYEDALQQVGEDLLNVKAVGLVMPWRGLPGGMVLHNCAPDQDTSGVRLMWVHRNKKAKAVQRLILEPMTSLTRTFAQWTPDEPE